MNLIIEFVSALKSAVSLTARRNIPNLNIVAGELNLQKERQVFLSTGMFITVGISGNLRGRILYRLDNVSALRLSGLMLRTNIVVIDEMAQSALSEFANIVSGATLSSGKFGNYNVDIYPPTIFQGNEITFNSLKIDIIHIPYEFNGGKLDVFVALEDYNIN